MPAELTLEAGATIASDTQVNAERGAVSAAFSKSALNNLREISGHRPTILACRRCSSPTVHEYIVELDLLRK